MAEYYLPDVNRLTELPCEYELKVLEKGQFDNLYLPEWPNALCSDRKHLDVLALGAYDCGKLIGLAGCSADADEMWQIGVDVLPEHRRKGIASALTSKLALEILKRGKVPFYCTKAGRNSKRDEQITGDDTYAADNTDKRFHGRFIHAISG